MYGGKVYQASLTEQANELKKQIAGLEAQSAKENTGGSIVPNRTVGAQDTTDNTATKSDLSVRLQMVKAEEEDELESAKLTCEQKMAIESKYTEDEGALIQSAANHGELTQQQADDRIFIARSELGKKLKQLAEEAEKDQEKRQKTLAEFDAEMNSDKGQKYAEFFGETRIESARTAVAMASDAQEAANLSKAALKQLQDDYEKAGKSISGAWRQSILEIDIAGMNWKTQFTSLITGVTDAFGKSVSQMIMDGKSFAETFTALMKTAITDVISQFVSMGAKWVATEALKKTATTTSAAAETSATAAAQATSTTVVQAAATAQVAVVKTAAEAMTAAYAAVGEAAAAAWGAIGGPIASAAALSAEIAIMQPLVAKAAIGFMEGGYTGDGGVSQIAGIVHAGEYVLPAGVTSAFNLQNKSVPQALGALAGSGGGDINLGGINITIAGAGNLSSQSDVSALAQQLTSAIKAGVGDAVRMANTICKSGANNAQQSGL
jgi:hypothetical protein